jgi:hypothetical protein
MAETKNTFLQGRMNQDIDSRILPEGEYREAINLMISRSEGSTVGEFENVLGNTLISTISANKLLSVIGHCVDDTNNLVYLFVTTFSNSNSSFRAGSTETCSILQVNLSNPATPTVLVNGYWLNLNKQFPIHAANILEGFLFWTDNLNQPRKININTAVADPLAYTEEMQISVAKYYPYNPIIPMERQTGIISGAVGNINSSTQIQLTSGNSNIKVGDVVTPNDKTDVVASTIRNVRPPVKVVEILDPTAAGGPTKFKVSPAIITDPSTNPPTTGQVTRGTLVDFSRTSMQNRSEQYLSNYSLQLVSSTGLGSTFFEVHADSNDNISTIFQGVPRVGDIVTIVTPGANSNNIPNTGPTQAAAYKYNIRVAKVTMNMSNTGTDYTPRPDPRFMKIELDKDMTAGGALTGLTGGDTVLIGSNSDYEVNFPGDTKFLDDRFVRFSYRFKFEDNEYSLMAPFSKIMFIPKQYGQFNLGQIDTPIPGTNTYGINNYYQDEIDAYTSTILEWFENDIDSIGLKLPLPSSLTDLQTKFKVSKIDILYKESDALAVKVLETVDLSTPNLSTETIKYNDDIQGLKDQLYFNYVYKSNKPYKTLPEDQTTRVYDKVPIKALAQEIISNRVVYGNFLEKMTPPEAIDYSAGVTNTDFETSDYGIQYPYQTTKQNRIYQVGFVLADYYGRQSDVILSSNDSVNNVTGSTVSIPYRDANDAITEPVFDWLGSNLSLTINEAIASSTDAGIYREAGYVKDVSINTAGTSYEANTTYATTNIGGAPGTGLTVRVTSVNNSGAITGVAIVTAGQGYNDSTTANVVGGANNAIINIGKTGDANPLGWYTYKIVVKQQQQEYYNVYLPGFINGLPINNRLWNKVPYLSTSTPPISPGFTSIETERGKIFFSSLLSDNINKIPRNLREVGPTDQEFNSDEQMFIRVNNPNAFALNVNTSYEGVKLIKFVENAQYYPEGNIQNVLTLSSVKENELAAVPFQRFRIAPTITPTNTAPTEASQEFPQGGFTAGDQGQYGLTTRYVPSGTQQVVTTERGSIPWGDVGSYASFYGADQNPFIMKVGQPGNFDNPIGAFVIDESEYGQLGAGTSLFHDTNFEASVYATSGGPLPTPIISTYQRIICMKPKLTVAETKPVDSLLEIFWETAMSGKLEVLNSMIETNYNGAIGTNVNVGDFEEDESTNTAAGPQIKFINGSGSEINTLQAVSISAVYRASAPTTPIFNQDGSLPFTIALVGGAPATEAQISTNSVFWYGDSSYVNDSYIFDLTVTSGSSSEYVDTLSSAITLSLINKDPIIYDNTGAALGNGQTVTLTGTAQPNIDTVDLYQFSGKNGSADAANDTNQLQWSIANFTQGGTIGTGTPPFVVDSTGKVSSTAQMVNETAYLINVVLADANNSTNPLVNVLTRNVNLSFTAGTLYAPIVIGSGMVLNDSDKYDIYAATAPTGKQSNQSGFWGFVNGSTASTNSNFTSTTGLPSNMQQAATFPGNPSVNTFNIREIYNNAQTPTTSCRGDLFAGTISIKPTYAVYQQGTGTMTGRLVIQHRYINATTGAPTSGWASIDTMSSSPDAWSASAGGGGTGGTFVIDFNLNQTAGTTLQYDFRFDVLGQYRVVVDDLQNAEATGYGRFYVNFGDGTYVGLSPQGSCTP